MVIGLLILGLDGGSQLEVIDDSESDEDGGSGTHIAVWVLDIVQAAVLLDALDVYVVKRKKKKRREEQERCRVLEPGPDASGHALACWCECCVGRMGRISFRLGIGSTCDELDCGHGFLHSSDCNPFEALDWADLV